MSMRSECKHYESRTYATGDAVHKCNLDKAPDAPWRCPDPCDGYERRLAADAWAHASVVAPPSSRDVPGLDDGSASAVLEAAEEIIKAMGASILEEIESVNNAKRRWWHRKKS